jgi:multiple sugar transport system ATP-binding protein
MTSTVSLRNVHKTYGGEVEVIHGIDLDIVQGEFLVLVGPSGCGKSTLLRMIAGLEDISAGTISINGAVVNDVDPRDRDIAMVFQSYALYPHMTVHDNLAFGLKLHGASKPEIARLVETATNVLGLDGLLDRYPRQLSGGQRQRVAMGRAMVRDPKVFLFDEPLSNLDAQLRVQMRVEIKALHQRLKTTAVYVTHDQIEAMTMADRIVIMRKGRIEQVASPLDLYDHPASVFVAQFIGSPAMNIFHGHIRLSDGGPAFEMVEGTRLKIPKRARVSDGQPVIFGIRPEHLEIRDGGSLNCTVDVLEPLGREILLHGRAGPNSICIAPGRRISIKAGQTVGLDFDPERACVFDSVNERSLLNGDV